MHALPANTRAHRWAPSGFWVRFRLSRGLAEHGKFHSCRNAIMGSTRIARLAGM
jgi:hypothetical protein